MKNEKLKAYILKDNVTAVSNSIIYPINLLTYMKYDILLLQFVPIIVKRSGPVNAFTITRCNYKRILVFVSKCYKNIKNFSL